METRPGPLTLTLTGTPREAASAFAVTLAGSFTMGARGAATPGVPGPGTTGGGGAGVGGLGRNAATSAPPMDGCVPVGESTTGALPGTQGSAAVVGLPATFTPPSSFHAIAPASCASDASRAMPAAGRKQSTVAGSAGA
jgi:hypothetical protein